MSTKTRKITTGLFKLTSIYSSDDEKTTNSFYDYHIAKSGIKLILKGDELRISIFPSSLIWGPGFNRFVFGLSDR